MTNKMHKNPNKNVAEIKKNKITTNKFLTRLPKLLINYSDPIFIPIHIPSNYYEYVQQLESKPGNCFIYL